MRPPLIFISYRRDDTGPYALALRSELELRVDGVPVFLDVNRIQGGNLWAKVLDDALAQAAALVALIGSNWVGELEDGRSRIDDPDDWVRREVTRALRRSRKSVLPVLVNDAPIPDRARLPKDLGKLFDVQAIPLRTQSWDADVANLCRILESSFGVRVKKPGEILPTPDDLKAIESALSDEELREAQEKGLLKGWEVEVVHDATTGFVRECLRKEFVCETDTDAFRFVNDLMPLAQSRQHHPKIEIMFRTVVIRLSTLDAGHRITTFDRQMAREIDRVFGLLGS